jgi:hypothetical protein
MCLTIDFSSAAPAIITQLIFAGLIVGAIVWDRQERKREWDAAKQFFNNLANPNSNQLEPFDK